MSCVTRYQASETRPNPRVQIRGENGRVVTAEKRSGPLWNGALISFFSGFIPTMAIGAADSYDWRYYKKTIIGVSCLVGGIGAAVGVGIDASIKGNEVLYKAP